MADVTFDMKKNQMRVHQERAEPWTVTLVDTGDNSMTGGRLKRVSEYIKDEEAFCFNYGDGVSDLDISSLVEFHFAHGKQATLTATFAPGRFGALEINNNQINSFKEKPEGDGARINGGFFVLSPRVLSHLKDDTTIWEQEPLNNLATDGELMAFEHDGFWQPMDTLREKIVLNDLWDNKKALWKKWK